MLSIVSAFYIPLYLLSDSNTVMLIPFAGICARNDPSTRVARHQGEVEHVQHTRPEFPAPFRTPLVHPASTGPSR